jgi:hypothetical protein
MEMSDRLILVGEDNPISLDPQFALYYYPVGCCRLSQAVDALLAAEATVPK